VSNRLWRLLVLVVLAVGGGGAAPAGTAFHGWRAAYWNDGVYVRTIGGAPKRIRWGSNYSHLNWSPDGRYLAYSHWGIYVTSADGARGWRVTRVDPWALWWSPDGRRLAYGIEHGVWVVSWTGRGNHRVVRTPGFLRTPGGVAWVGADTIVCACENLIEVNLRTHRRRVVARGAMAVVAVSADRKLIAFGSKCGYVHNSDYFCRLELVDADGRGRRVLVKLAYVDAEEPEKWSPVWIRAKHVLVVRDTVAGGMRIDADTGRRDRLPAPPLAISSTGKILYRFPPPPSPDVAVDGAFIFR